MTDNTNTGTASPKFRAIEQKKTFTKRSRYENALTRDRAKNRAKTLSYAEINIGDGEMANVYFTPIPGTALKLRDPGLQPLDAYRMMIEILADCVVDPETGKPLYTIEEWEKEDPDFVGVVSGAVMGVQFVSASEAETLSPDEILEVASDPNPLDGIAGSDSPTASISNSEEEDEREQETSNNG